MPYSVKSVASAVTLLILIALCMAGILDPPFAMLSGILLAFTLGHPAPTHNNKVISILLRLSIIGLGFGINLKDAVEAGSNGLLFTIITIALTLVVGVMAGRWMAVSKNVALLISVGTAICGGSAIAAISPVIDAKPEELSVSFGIVFLLNAIALFLFPIVGFALTMDQVQFGLWSAIAIHDTSSVVGAAQIYGDQALQIATTVKLERALWIIPLSLSLAYMHRKSGTVKFPYFILLFIVAIVLNTYSQWVHSIGNWIVPLSKKGMTITLLLIGAGLSISSIKKVGVKPLLLGFGLWILIATGSLALILFFY